MKETLGKVGEDGFSDDRLTSCEHGRWSGSFSMGKIGIAVEEDFFFFGKKKKPLVMVIWP